MTTYTVDVSNISPSTTEDELQEFFSFCGTIQSIDYKQGTAAIRFEKPAAAKTALMLDGGTLKGANITVTSSTPHDEEHHDDNSKPIDQSDKPRAGIVAEFLAKGYQLSDAILHRAIDVDREKGISKRFRDFIAKIDSTIGARALGPEKTISGQVRSTADTAAQQVKDMDERKGYSKSLEEYYSKALASPLGKQVYEFYTSSQKQVKQIHEEAMRIAEHQKNSEQHKSSGQETSTEGSASQS